MAIQIHPTAIVSKGAELGEDVIVGPYAVIDENVIIGDRTELKPFAHICDYTKVGSDCTFHEHSVIGGLPQDLSYKGEESWVHIGNNVTCREFVTVNRAAGEGNITQIGDDAFIMECVHIAHNVVIGKHCTIANKTGIAGHVRVGDRVVIGGMSGIHQFVRIGSYCMLGAMSKYTQDVLPFGLASGNPSFFYDINRVGLQRNGFTSKTRMKIREMHKIIYSTPIRKNAIAVLSEQYPGDAEAMTLIDFLNVSTRGLLHSIKNERNKKEG